MQDVDDDPMTWESTPKQPEMLALALESLQAVERAKSWLPAVRLEYKVAQLRMQFAQAIELRRIANVLERMAVNGEQNHGA